MRDGLQRLAAWVLGYNVAVILWGAYVRATGSGAGCGSHWPLCNGAVIPRGAGTATLIEYSHRLTSGVALLAVLLLVIQVWRRRPSGDPARLGAGLSLFFILAEAGIGAGLVLFELVADNASFARALFMAAHLVNTFVLLACLTLTVAWLGEPSPGRLRGDSRARLTLVAGAVLLLAAGTSGAVAALGDTLYPSTSLAAALRADLSATSHVLLRLRVLHPALAIAAGLVVALSALRLAGGSSRAARQAHALAALIALQLAAGFVNVMLLAPVWMQIVHLLLADAIWILFVAFAAGVLAERPDGLQAAMGVGRREPGTARAPGSVRA